MPFVQYGPQLKALVVRMFVDDCRSLDDIRNLLRLPLLAEKTVREWVFLQSETHSVIRNPASYATRGRRRIFSDEQLKDVLDILAKDTTLYLDEIREALYFRTSEWPTLSTIHASLNRLGVSLKKTQRISVKRSATKRAIFTTMIGKYDSNQLLFADETHASAKATERRRGRALRGARASVKVGTIQGKRFSCLPVVSQTGVLACMVKRDSIKRKHFIAFLKAQVLPVMNPYPQPWSVLVLDNASIHKGDGIVELFKQKGCHLVYNAPYSPDFCPEEKAFSLIKARLRRERTLQHLRDDDEIIEAVKNAVYEVCTENVMRALYRSSGYA